MRLTRISDGKSQRFEGTAKQIKHDLFLIGVKNKTMGFEEVEHTADTAIRIFGVNLQELLISAARGMTSLMVSDPSKVATEVEKFFELDAIDAEDLLVEWLNELAFWAETELLVFTQYRIRNLSATHLQARIFGGKVSELEKHIKAVTFHNLKIMNASQGLEATIVFDV
jgi:SHS2 domain-containing protein